MKDAGEKNENRPHEGESIPTSSSGPGMVGLGEQIGRYKLLSVLGEGGYGIVYLAEQQKPIRRRVALKIIKPGMDTKQVIARFEAERQALALLDHPNIAYVYDAGTTKFGRPYFAMEYVKGVPITEHCDCQRLTIEERLKVFVKVCEAIQHAHQKGIIHRDIKPSNIQVCIQGEQMVPKVIDFGVAKALNQPLTERTLVTEEGQFIGTPEYMSPEQAELTHQDVDTRSDIYSLGVVLYELLTGVLPFDAQTLREGGVEHIRQVIREQEPKTPSTRLSTLSAEDSTKIAKHYRVDFSSLQRRLRGELDWIVMKALEKDRTRRYDTANSLAQDLERHLNNESVIARPPSKLYRFEKLVRRKKAVFVNMSAVMAAICVVDATVFSIITVGLVWSLFSGIRFFDSPILEPVTFFNGLKPIISRSTAIYLVLLALIGMIFILIAATRKFRAFFPLACGCVLLLASIGSLCYRLIANPLIKDVTVRGFTGQLCYGPDDNLLVGMVNGNIRCYDSKVEKVLREYESSQEHVRHLTTSYDGHRLLATGQAEGSMVLIELPTGKLLKTITIPGFKAIDGVFSPDSRKLAVYVTSEYQESTTSWKKPEEGNLRICSAEDGELLFCEKTPCMYGSWQAIDWKGNIIAMIEEVEADGAILWDVEKHVILHNLVHPNSESSPLSVALSPDVKKMAVGYNSNVAIWDVGTGQLLYDLVSPDNWVVCLDFSPDGRLLASGEGNSAVWIWDVESGSQLFHFGMGPWQYSNYTYSVRFDSKGRRLACGTANDHIVIWRIPD